MGPSKHFYYHGNDEEHDEQHNGGRGIDGATCGPYGDDERNEERDGCDE